MLPLTENHGVSPDLQLSSSAIMNWRPFASHDLVDPVREFQVGDVRDLQLLVTPQLRQLADDLAELGDSATAALVRQAGLKHASRDQDPVVLFPPA